jgi:hypothetical protein
MFEAVVKVDDLQFSGEVILAHFLQATGSIDEQYDFLGPAHAAAQRFAPQPEAEVLDPIQARQPASLNPPSPNQ